MNENEYARQEYPISRVIMGFAFIAGGFYLYIQTGQWLFSSIFLALGLLSVLFASVLKINANRITRTLDISRTGLVQRYQREISFNEISTIQLGSSYNRKNGRSYRIEIALKDGEIIPLRKHHSSGRRGKEKKAQELRRFIGVGGADSSLGGMFNAALKMAKQVATPQFQAEQESISGNQAQIHERGGVRWQLETVGFGNMPISRWHALDYTLPSNFLYLAQKISGQKELPAQNLLNPVYEKLFEKPMQIYGFNEADIPNLPNADLFQLDSQLSEHFFAYTSDETRARQILNAWTKQPIIAWAKEHPFNGDSSDQLAILFSPNGLYLAVPGYVNEIYLDQLAELGTALVLAQ